MARRRCGGDSVAHLGELYLPIKDHELTLHGLPSTEELSGLNVTLGRPGAPVEVAKIELGTLRSVTGDDQKLNDTLDQAGWSSGTPDPLTYALARPITRYRDGKTATWHLLTCLAPMSIEETGRPEIRFGFCDLPCKKAPGWTFEAQKIEDAHPLGADDNPLEGYTWWLDQEGGGDHVMVSNLGFRPLKLLSVELSATGQPTEAVLTGRIAVPVRKSEVGEALFAEAFGEAALTISWTEEGPRSY